MRDEDTIVSQVRRLLEASEELKTAQFVGDSQVVVKHTTASLTAQSDANTYITRAYASCRVTASNLNDGNVLICYCLPEVRVNGQLVDNLDDTYQLDISKADEGYVDRMGFQANIFHIDDGGSTIPAETYTVTFHVYSSADVTITAWEGIFDE